jgi:hypothetical protein
LHITLRLHPGRFDIGGIMRLLGNDEAEERLKRGEPGSQVNQALQANLAEFRTTREKYLTYS